MKICLIHSLPFSPCPVLWGLLVGSPTFQLGPVDGEPQQETEGRTLSEVGVFIPRLPPCSVVVELGGFFSLRSRLLSGSPL